MRAIYQQMPTPQDVMIVIADMLCGGKWNERKADQLVFSAKTLAREVYLASRRTRSDLSPAKRRELENIVRLAVLICGCEPKKLPHQIGTLPYITELERIQYNYACLKHYQVMISALAGFVRAEVICA